MIEPKIAIYMSCYNHEKYVAEAVNSILDQSYGNWELYVVNDGSTDRSGEILESFQDERIHYFNFEKNTKFIGASNFLQSLIEGLEVDFITVLASDDMWKKDKLKKQVAILEAHPEYKCCFTWDELLFCNKKDPYIGRENYSHHENQSRFDWIRTFVTSGNCINACSMLMRKHTFYELGRMNENFIQLGDLRLWLKLVSKHPFYMIEERLTYYRRHETNLSKPSEETTLRSTNEYYIIFRDLIRELDGSTFYRSFYQCLPFVFCDTAVELLAAKFFLMAGYDSRQSQQSAMDIYYDNCDNEEFTALLERNYHIGPREFLEYSGRRGLQLCFMPQDWLDTVFQANKQREIFYPCVVLLSAIDAGHLNEESISWFAYSTVLDLYNLTNEDDGEESHLQRVISYLDHIRLKKSMKKKGRNIFFFIAEGSDFDPEAYIKSIDNDTSDEYAVSYIPTMHSFFHREGMPEEGSFLLERLEYVNLINEDEKCLYFLDELGMEADVIYFVDCLKEEYECVKMIAGYALSVELYSIMHLKDRKEEEIHDLIKCGIVNQVSLMNHNEAGETND